MKIWIAAMVAMLALGGCNASPQASVTRSSGSLALSNDDALLYAADADNGVLAVVEVESEQVLAKVPVGPMPERVVVGPDDTVYVTNRRGRSVSVIRRGEWSEAARVEVGVEPVGMAVSPDNRTLYVVSSAAVDDAATGTVTAIDAQTLQPRWELKVGEEPRAIALLGGERAMVSLFKQGDVVLIDLAKPEVIKPGTDLYARANASASSATGAGGSKEMPSGFAQSLRPRGISDLVVSPEQGRVFAPARWASEAVLGGSDTSGGSTYGGGPCRVGAVVAASVVTFENDGTPQVDDVSACGASFEPDRRDRPRTLIPPVNGVPVQGPTAAAPIQGPTAAAVDPTGAWLFVVNHESNNVAVVSTGRTASPLGRGEVQSLVMVGAGPSGIAITRDGTKAFVLNAFDHTISTLVSDGATVTSRSRPPIRVAEDVLPADVVAGRKLFFTAIDSRMNTTGISCGSCHLEGREDGHVWQFADGPRQTPSLAGRLTSKTAPFHWNGEFPTLNDFMSHTVQQRMGGAGVTPTMVRQLEAFIASIPAPDNPHRRATPSEAQQRGELVFKRAGCDECHVGEALTNNSFADVGTGVTEGSNPDALPRGLNTPSLLGVSRTAPYLHDGSAPTLKARLLMKRELDLHGRTSTLSEAELDDLVEYLKGL